MKKIISILLIFSIIMCMFASCEQITDKKSLNTNKTSENNALKSGESEQNDPSKEQITASSTEVTDIPGCYIDPEVNYESVVAYSLDEYNSKITNIERGIFAEIPIDPQMLTLKTLDSSRNA